MMKWLRRLLPRSLVELTSVDAYRLWARHYPPVAHNPLMHAEEAAVHDLLPELNGKHLLDLGCGTGRYMRLAHQRGAQFVTGIDNSAAMLRRGNLPDTMLGTVNRLPLASGCVDVVICGLVLGHVPALDAPLHEIGRVLKTGGSAIISDFHPYQYFSGARRTFSADDKTYQVAHYPHLLADYVTVAARAGLRLTALREPVMDAPSGRMPVVMVMRFERD